MLGIVCDQRMPIILKVAVYIRPSSDLFTYSGSEIWAPRKVGQDLLRDENVEIDDGNKYY